MKFIEDHKEDYSPILWIDAKSPETVQSSFVRCADELRLSVDSSSTQWSALEDSPTVQAVLRWLRDRNEFDDEWLVVVDNADELSWGINKVIPKGRRGNIIITSQDGQSPRLFDRGCEKLCVHTMEPSEAKALLRHLNWDFNLAPASIQDISREIVDLLGCLALAVDLAGAYIHEDADKEDSNQEAALERYLVDYGRHQDALLRKDYYRGLSSYDKTVWTVWDTTLETIERRYPEVPAGLSLAFLARFNRQTIQSEMFRLASLGLSTVRQRFCHQGQDLPDWLKGFIQLNDQDWDSFRYREAVKILIRYNLLQQVHGEWPGVSLHSLVQWRATNYKKDGAWDLWYLILILAVFITMNREKARPQFRRYLIPHLPDVGESCLHGLQIDDERRVFLWHTIAVIFWEEGRWKEAEKLNLLATETGKRVLGVEHIYTLVSMMNLASTYREQGRWEEAEKLQLQVLETQKKGLGVEHPGTLISMINLAHTYGQQGRVTEAEKLYLQVLETQKRTLGVEHPHTLISMINLAHTYGQQGRVTEAEKLYLQVLETQKRTLGVEHPHTLVSMSNLAFIYHKQGHWGEAEKLYLQVLKARETVLGAKHPDTLTSRNNLAETFVKQERHKEAEKMHLHVLETRKRVLPAAHPDTLLSMFNLALVYHAQGQGSDSVPLMRAVVEQRINLSGADHPRTLEAKRRLQEWLDE